MKEHNGTQQNNQVYYHKTFNNCNGMTRYRDTEKSAFIVNFEHISHLVLVFNFEHVIPGLVCTKQSIC